MWFNAPLLPASGKPEAGHGQKNNNDTWLIVTDKVKNGKEKRKAPVRAQPVVTVAVRNGPVSGAGEAGQKSQNRYQRG
jgi:hypothetical protein